MGRTGDWFGYEYSGITPDVITLAKGLGGGLPLGAMIALGASAYLFQPGDHGSTFGGNPVTTAAALAVIKVIERENLMVAAVKHGNYLLEEIAQMQGVKEVRGAGLLIGIEFDSEIATKIMIDMRAHGVLINAATANTVRIAPALNVTTAQTAKFVEILRKVLSDVK